MCAECIEMENAVELDSLRMELSDARQEIGTLTIERDLVISGTRDFITNNEIRLKTIMRLAKKLNTARRDRDRFKRQLDDTREALGWNC